MGHLEPGLIGISCTSHPHLHCVQNIESIYRKIVQGGKEGTKKVLCPQTKMSNFQPIYDSSIISVNFLNSEDTTLPTDLVFYSSSSNF